MPSLVEEYDNFSSTEEGLQTDFGGGFYSTEQDQDDHLLNKHPLPSLTRLPDSHLGGFGQGQFAAITDNDPFELIEFEADKENLPPKAPARASHPSRPAQSGKRRSKTSSSRAQNQDEAEARPESQRNTFDSLANFKQQQRRERQSPAHQHRPSSEFQTPTMVKTRNEKEQDQRRLQR
ncbi:hypothetical protein SEMRO_578_G169890.1 [Seminavis robusta]|uniref:Uncharacterized protein n=1 Tax=Seminavis robusta TaxID=568900 RepID=A0A9N8HFL5_9STRA|nr:hypothetical protein SEMRO_578_G169890.1 [Seminavis robusta]|eukprot:Sro578_g169890.1 n/a (178) ;mRNA; r:56831-57560